MGKIVEDLKALIAKLRDLNDDTSDEMSKTVGRTSQATHDAINALESKIAEVLRRKFSGERLDQDTPE